MTQSELEAMLKESELMSYGLGKDGFKFFSACSTFAKLVAAKEREACAQICDMAILQNQEAINELEDDEHIAKCFIQGAITQLVKTSKAIRARGEA